MHRLSANMAISSDVGFGFNRNAFSKEPLTVVSMDVRFLRLLPMASGVVKGLLRALGLLIVLSASDSHFCSKGFSLHIFLNDRFNASNLDMVVWEKSLPYNFPMAIPTSPWVKPKTYEPIVNQNIIQPRLTSQKNRDQEGIGLILTKCHSDQREAFERGKNTNGIGPRFIQEEFFQ